MKKIIVSSLVLAFVVIAGSLALHASAATYDPYSYGSYMSNGYNGTSYDPYSYGSYNGYGSNYGNYNTVGYYPNTNAYYGNSYTGYPNMQNGGQYGQYGQYNQYGQYGQYGQQQYGYGSYAQPYDFAATNPYGNRANMYGMPGYGGYNGSSLLAPNCRTRCTSQQCGYPQPYGGYNTNVYSGYGPNYAWAY